MSDKIAPTIWITIKIIITFTQPVVCFLSADFSIFFIPSESQLAQLDKSNQTTCPQYGHSLTFKSNALLQFGHNL